MAGCITALGLALRLVGISWSLPDSLHPLATYHPDELLNLSTAALADLAHGKLDIRLYNYGAFYFYLVSLAQTVARGYGLIPALPAGAGGAAGLAAVAPQQAALFLTGRLVTAVMGALTVPIVFAAGRRAYGARSGLLAAALFAVMPLAVLHSHFLTVDVPATLFISLALLWSLRLRERPDWKNAAVAGAWVGLATATKYTSVVVLLAPAAALMLAAPLQVSRRRSAATLLGASALAFIAGCPGIVLHWNEFWNGVPGNPQSGVHYEMFVHSREGHGYLFVHTGTGWTYHLLISLPYGLGIPLLLVALASAALAWRLKSPADRVLLLFVAAYYVLTGLSAVRFSRYMLPLFPPLALLTGRLLADLCSHGRARLWGIGVTASVLLLTGIYAAGLDNALVGIDPRDRAAAYMNAHLPQNATVAFATVPWFYSPPLSPLFGALAAPERARAAQTTTRYRLLIPTVEWSQSVLTPPPDALVLSSIESFHPVTRLRLAKAVAFVRAIPAAYARKRFRPRCIWLMPDFISPAPEDILYVAPTVTLYTRPGSLSP